MRTMWDRSELNRSRYTFDGITRYMRLYLSRSTSPWRRHVSRYTGKGQGNCEKSKSYTRHDSRCTAKTW